MRKIICNSTPLIVLNKIGMLDLLEKIYNEIIIPNAVYEEVFLNSSKDTNNFIKHKHFIKVMNIKNNEAKNLFTTILHKGEVEVMILSSEIEADICIIDDMLARKYAKYYGIEITGTIGVIVKSKELGYIHKIKPILDKIIENGFYVDKKLYKRILEFVNEMD